MNQLKFLLNASNDDLKTLCDIVVKDKQGDWRFTEELSFTDTFKSNYPNNVRAMLPELVDEFRRFGGNSITNLFRGEGPEYSKILRDVARKNGVRYNHDDADEVIEAHLLKKIFEVSLANMSDDGLKEMLQELGYPTTNFARQTAIATLMVAWKAGGFKSYMLLVSVVNCILKFMVGRGLSIAANAMLTRMASIMMGPIGWALTALWTIIDIAGPAYRVTVPAVIQIAFIRQSLNRKLLVA